MKSLLIIPSDLLHDFLRNLSGKTEQVFNALEDAELSTSGFSFYTSVASVFSSKIEGEDIELDSFIKHKRDGFPFKPDYTRKTDDLYSAYTFAQKNKLNSGNIEKAHALLAVNFVARHWLGKFRNQNMYVTTPDGKIEYVAALPQEVESEMQKFYHDLDVLLQTELSTAECFYYAAMLHLVFVKIHPWIDGNGRSARLIEKWFLAEKMGPKAWFIQSEKYYYLNHDLYYQNIRRLGIEYESLDYSKALSFLLMLPASIQE